MNVTVAIGLMVAMGDIRRFPTPRRLSSHIGLVARVHRSAEKRYQGQITTAGRGHARWLAIQAAHEE